MKKTRKNFKLNKLERSLQHILKILAPALIILTCFIQFTNAQTDTTTYYEIWNSHNGKRLAIVAGDDYESGHIYHQEAKSRDNARWEIIPDSEGFYWFKEKKWGRPLAAGDFNNGRVWGKVINHGAHSEWQLVKKGENKYQIINKKYGKAIVSGNNPDGNLYFQEPGERINSIWNFTVVGKTTDSPQ